MSDFLKSALGYLSPSGSGNDNEFVGQLVELGDIKLRVKRVIAEGEVTLNDLRGEGGCTVKTSVVVNVFNILYG